LGSFDGDPKSFVVYEALERILNLVFNSFYVFYVYMGQVPEIKLIMMMMIR